MPSQIEQSILKELAEELKDVWCTRDSRKQLECIIAELEFMGSHTCGDTNHRYASGLPWNKPVSRAVEKKRVPFTPVVIETPKKPRYGGVKEFHL